MKKLLLASSIALAAMNAQALQIDYSGTGSLSGSQFYSELSLLTSSAIFKSVQSATGDTTITGGTLYAQAQFDLGPSISKKLTYQIIVPITTEIDNSGLTTDSYTFTIAGPTQFAMFIGDAAPSVLNGTGFGDLNGGSLGTGQLAIAKGTVSVASGNDLALQIKKNSNLVALDSCGPATNLCNPLFNGVTTRTISGSTNLDVDVAWQDSNYIVSDLVNADLLLNIDTTLQNLAFNAPFNSPNAASTKVVNYQAFLGTDAPKPIQDQTCVDSSFGTCDLEVQIGGNSKFNDQPIPEPASLSLVGLGLAAFGTLRRRNKKA